MRYAAVMLVAIVAGACLWAGCKPAEESTETPAAPVAAPKVTPAAVPAEAPDGEEAASKVKCLVCGMTMDPSSEMAVKVECADCDVDCYVCQGSCEETYNADPAKYCPKGAAGEACEDGVCPLPEKSAAVKPARATAKPAGAAAVKAEPERPAETAVAEGEECEGGVCPLPGKGPVGEATAAYPTKPTDAAAEKAKPEAPAETL